MTVVSALALVAALVLWAYRHRQRLKAKRAAATALDELLDALDD